MFSCEFYKTSKNSFLQHTFERLTASFKLFFLGFMSNGFREMKSDSSGSDLELPEELLELLSVILKILYFTYDMIIKLKR